MLVIDEAYGLYGSTEMHKTVMDNITAYCPTEGGTDMCIILIGYENQIATLLEMNVGLKRRFDNSCRIVFESYNEDELGKIMALKAKDKDINLPLDVRLEAAQHLARQSKLLTFGNGGAVESLLEQMISKAELRVQKSKKGDSRSITLDDFKAATDLPPLDGLPLLPQIVEEVSSMAAYNNMCSLRGMPTPDIEHMLFVVSRFALLLELLLLSLFNFSRVKLVQVNHSLLLRWQG